MKREDEIITIVNERKKVEVNELAEMLEVSRVTIRKDLDKLVERGIIIRQHGYAEVPNQNDLTFRMSTNYDRKLRIARMAAKTIRSGETILIESGSTCALLAEELAKTKRDITILTNSCFIANYIRKYEGVKIVLLGGDYQKDSQVNVGPLVKEVMKNFFVEKFFIGIDGFDEENGFTGSDISRVSAVKDMAEGAKHIIVLTDSTKFDARSMISAVPFERVSEVFTDNMIKEETEYFLQNRGILVYKA
ncbi:transcriptional regulator, DeoR family [Pilibacter termitis]|uniref:Lactose phosphotransferase system repressor n=1 Tax=Pilibacter termitis TaxID=263852 RepID=A0A1T4MGU3_9ENTE|nr:DeoR/GlpR family DNA-binding transcription regulator [Pilibacter termitis]SJZ66162.1 transcriptional regulator, DeoR family [Pilibacter termitis]